MVESAAAWWREQWHGSKDSFGEKRDCAKLTAKLRGVLIPADLEYSEWFAALAAIHHETRGSDEGFALACEWSSDDPRYNEAQVERMWDSFDPNHPTPKNMGTLINLARQYQPEFAPPKNKPLSYWDKSKPQFLR